MSVVTMAVGATTPDGATFATKVDGGGPVRVAVADNAGMTGPLFTAGQAVTAQGFAKVPITGLDPGTRYWWQVEDDGVLDTSDTGQFVTHPPLGVPGSFTMVVMGDAGLSPTSPGVAGGELDPNRLSNHQVFATIANRAIAEGWLMGHMIGDQGYPDWGSGLTESLANRRTFHDDNLRQPNQATLRRLLSMSDLYDDHDSWGNNGDGTYALKGNAAAIYRERFCHYPLPDPDAIYWRRPVARTLIIGADVRYNRSPNSDPDGPAKTMLGTAQKTWMESVLTASDAELLIWLMPQQWMGTTVADSWASFQTEQAELVQMFGDLGWLGRMRILAADAHMVALDSGANSPGGIPVLQCAALDATPLGSTAAYDHGGQLGRNQYGTITVTDFGSAIQVRLAGWEGTTELVSLQTAIGVVSPTPPVGVTTVQEFAPILGGSHDPVFEARVLTSFQSGPDPGGSDLPIVDGDVQFDATAQVHATLGLTTQGIDPATGRPWFPRLAADLLAPYGNEVFVRRGIDLGGTGVLWSPLGYFRVETVEQGGDIEATIGIGGSDRMAAIVESQLVTPREFTPITPVASFFAALVGAVYPDAIIVFDDDSALAELGRQIVVDESRYEPLLELADGLGKVMFFDGEGFLRVESPPDETVPVWTVAAGRDGVLVEASRRLTRIGAPNGVLVLGEGGSDQEPVRGLAVDTGPRSPTRWGGPYGRVLVREQLTTVTTVIQAEQAAREILRRRLGVPHSADFGAITNPGLRPRHPIVVVHRDGNRDRHIVQTLTVPLTAAGVMSGTTRERTSVVIGSVIV